MKKLLLILSVIGSALTAQAQMADTTLPFYKRFPTITPFKILLSDSTTLYTRSDLPANKPVAFIVFSPDCHHCQHAAEEIVSLQDKLKHIQIVMITMHPFDAMKDFISTYKLKNVPNVVVGRDIHYLMPVFYKFHSLPFHAMYNKEGNLLSVFEGSMNMGTLAEVMRE